MPLPVDLNTIAVTGTYPNIAGQPQSGYVTFDPGAVVTDATGHVILTGAVRCNVANGVLQPPTLPCTDNSGLNPTGFAYTVTEVIGSSKRSYQVSLPHTLGASVDLSSLSPVTQPPTSNTFTGSNTWTGTQDFTGSPPIQLPSGASAGLVWTCQDSQGDGAWAATGAGLTNPMTGVGDTIYGGTSGVPTRLAAQTSTTKKFLTETGTGSAGLAPTWATISAGDVPTLNQNTTGTASNVTATLDQVPAPAGNVSLASHKITNLANGSASSDAAAFGQVPTSASTIGGLLAASNLSDVSSSSTARTNLGLGSSATHAATDFLAVTGGTLTGWLAPAVATLTFVGSGTTLVNAALGNSFVLTLTASTTTLGNPTNPVDGQTIRVRVIQDGTGSRTLAYGTAYDFGASSAPTLSTGANKVDILGFEYVASLSKWCYLGSGLGF
jgi:hypothetical protein